MNAETAKHLKFIMIQLPEYCDAKGLHIKQVIKHLRIGKERIRRAGKKIENPSLPRILTLVFVF